MNTPTSFNRFRDQYLNGSSWSGIGTQSANAMAEVQAPGTTLLASVSSRTVGAIYDPNHTALGVDPEDLTFHETNECYCLR